VIIVHRCSCGHPDIYHRGEVCSSGWCRARIHELGLPEIIPTFVDGKLNDYLHKPGAAGSKTSGYNLCGCADCLALWATVKNDAVPLRAWCQLPEAA
jgi:hypothetical protein